MVPRRLGRGVLCVLVTGLLMLGCSLVPGYAETDRMVETVSTAIAYPRQDSALGLARAASGTAATVFRAEDLDAETLEEPRARLGLRLTAPVHESKFFEVEPVTACYLVEFNFYGATSTDRIRCPANAAELEIPPPPPQARIPDGTDEILAGRPPDQVSARDARTEAASTIPAPASAAALTDSSRKTAPSTSATRGIR